eukprot:COSAG01_NODE_30882_length_607_cov_51.358268_1_plen_97_part_10
MALRANATAATALQLESYSRTRIACLRRSSRSLRAEIMPSSCRPAAAIVLVIFPTLILLGEVGAAAAPGHRASCLAQPIVDGQRGGGDYRNFEQPGG